MHTKTRPRTRWQVGVSNPRRMGRRLIDTWRVLAAMVMIGSLISTIALAPAAPVTAAPPACENGQVWDDSQQMCVDPTPEGGDQQMATDTPADMPTDVPTETPADMPTETPTPGTISVYKYTCPQMYDFGQAGANPASDCTIPTDGVMMTLVPSDQQQQDQQTSGGVATFANVATGQFSLTETAPGNTASAAWSCESAMQAPTSGSGSQILGQVASGEQLSCRFYNVPNGITIQVNKFLCPDGYDVSGPNANPQADCTQAQNGVQFNVSGSTTGYSSQSNTGDSIPGAVTFGGLQPDTYTVTETLPAGIASAFVTQCVQTTLAGQQIPHYPTVTNGAIQYQFDNNDLSLTCDWYNVPSGGSPTATPTSSGSPTVTPTPTATSTEPSTLYIYKFLCPEGYNPGAMGANPATDCATPQNGVQFNITGKTNGYTSQSNTGDSIPGAVMFGGIAPDTYHVKETFPPNTDFAFITECKVEAPVILSKFAPLPINPVVNTTGETDIVVPGGVTITCSWYNVPKAGSSDLTVHKQNCDVETYVDNSTCTPNTTGVTFEVYRKDGANWVLKASAATDGTGTLALSGLNPGTYKLTELGGMWCHIVATHKNADGADVNALNPDGSFELVNGFETVVVVSNCTGGTGDITIYKWTCPAGYDYSKYGANPKADCTKATNGVQFNLAGQTKGYTSQSNTGDSIPGAVFFGSIPTDTYTVTETVPADTWYVFVWDCTGSSVNWVNPTPLTVNNVLTIKVAAKDKIVCNWYNVPNPTSGDLTIYKEWCSGPNFVSDVDCTIYEKGMKFAVNAWNGTAWVPVTTQTTNNLGYIALSGLTPGKYQVVEQGGTPCKVTATQLDPQTNKPVSVLNPDQSIPITNGRETVVKVYNCTPKGGTPPPTKTPGKFPNTGVDPADTGASQLSAQDTQVIEPGTPQANGGQQTTTTGTPEAATACPALAAADNAKTSPVGTPQPGETCARGQVPASISIPAIQVQATFEVKEIVGGELQAPTD
ncbi:MAG: prealbumin-like fold domain-containing protein, partial [Thermomicrobiales bacterium]